MDMKTVGYIAFWLVLLTFATWKWIWPWMRDGYPATCEECLRLRRETGDNFATCDDHTIEKGGY